MPKIMVRLPHRQRLHGACFSCAAHDAQSSIIEMIECLNFGAYFLRLPR